MRSYAPPTAGNPVLERRRLHGWILVAILTLAAGLRLMYISWGLPQTNEWHNSLNEDEWRMMTSVMNLDFAHGKFNPAQAIYGSLPLYFTYLALVTADACHIVRYVPDATWYYDRPLQLTRVYLISRLILVTISVFSIYLVFLLGKKVFSPLTGLTAALLFAVIPAHVVEAHYFKNNLIITFWFIVLALLNHRLAKNPSLRNHVLIGIGLGMATATQYNGCLFLVPVLVNRLVASGKRISMLASRQLISLYAAMVISFLLFNPFSVFQPQFAGNNLGSLTKAFQRDRYFNYPDPGILYYIRYLFPYSVSGPVLLAACIGVAMTRNRRRDWVLLASLGCLIMLPAASNFKVSRYVLFGAPFLCLYAARWLTASSRSPAISLLRCLFLVFALMWPALQSLAHLSLMAQFDPRLQAQQWLLAHVPPQTTVLTLHDFRGFYPPLLYPPRSPYRIIEDASSFPDLLGACAWPVVAVEEEILGVHEKYRTTALKYSRHQQMIAPLLRPDCYRLVKEFQNQPLWFKGLIMSRWLPFDYRIINPKVLVYFPVRVTS